MNKYIMTTIRTVLQYRLSTTTIPSVNYILYHHIKRIINYQIYYNANYHKFNITCIYTNIFFSSLYENE